MLIPYDLRLKLVDCGILLSEWVRSLHYAPNISQFLSIHLLLKDQLLFPVPLLLEVLSDNVRHTLILLPLHVV